MDATHDPHIDNTPDLHSSQARDDAASLASSRDRLNRGHTRKHHPPEDLDQLSPVHYHDLFYNMTQGCAFQEIVTAADGTPCDYRFLDMNPAFEQLTGLKRSETIGRLATHVLPDLEPFWIETYARVALSGQPIQFDHYTHTLNRYYRVYAYSPAAGYFVTIFMDVSDQKQVELQLNEVADKYFTLFNSTSDGVWIQNLDGEILEVNDAYCQMSGYTREELICMNISQIETAETLGEVKDRLRKLVQGSGHDRYESVHRRKDGTLLDVDVTALYFDRQGGRIAMFTRDNTAPKQLEERLSYLASFPECNPNPIVEVDMQGRIYYVNPAALSLFPDLLERGLEHDWFADWQTVIQTFNRGELDLQVRDVNTGSGIYQQSINYIRTTNLVRIYGIDITQRKQVEEAIRHSEEMYRTMVETAAEGIALAHSDGTIYYVNQQMANMLGYPVEEVLGKTIQDFMFDDLVVPVQEVRNILKGGTSLHGEHNFRRKDGSVLWTMYNATPIFNDQGVHTGNLAMHTDITSRKLSEEALRESEHRLSRAQEIAHLGSWELDLTSNHLTWSDEVYRIFGFQPQEFKATYEAFLEAVHPDDRAAVDAAYTNSVRDGADSYEIEHRLINQRTGEVRIVHEKCIHFRDASGNVIRSEGMVHDITQRKQAEEELRLGRNLLEQRVNDRTRDLNLANIQLRSEVLQRQQAQARLESSLFELKAVEEELRSNNAMLVETQRVLEAERQRYLDLFDLAPDAYLVTDIHGSVLEANRAAGRLFQTTHTDLVGEKVDGFIDPADRAVYDQLLLSLQDQPGLHTQELRLTPLGGPAVIADVTITAVKAHDGSLTLRWSLRDMTEPKQAQAIIHQNSLRNAVLSEVSQAMTEASLDEKAILDIVVKTTARLVGDSCVIALGSEDGQWLEPTAWWHKDPDSMALISELYAATQHPATEGLSGQVFRSSLPALVQSLGMVDISKNIAPIYQNYVDQVGVSSILIVPLQIGIQTIGTLGVSRDRGGQPYTPEDQSLMEILANRVAQTIHNARLYKELQNALLKELEMQDQLVQSEKFAAVGRLLASITHEINNPLQTIKNCIFLSQQDILPGSSVYEYLQLASKETDRLSNLVTQMREIYRPPNKGQLRPVDILKKLKDVRTLLESYLRDKHISWEVTPPEERLLEQYVVEAIPEQLKQVFLNIALNAIDAMEPDGGKIMIDFRLSDDGRMLGTRFTDTGPGLADEVKVRLFEPFTTTKEKGLGLGLVICYDIIKKHNGSIEAESQPGMGAEFTIWLPIKPRVQAGAGSNER